MKYEMQLAPERSGRHLTGHLCAWLLRDMASTRLINNIKPVSRRMCRDHDRRRTGIRIRSHSSIPNPWLLPRIDFCLGCELWPTVKSFNIPIITSRVVNINPDIQHSMQKLSDFSLWTFFIYICIYLAGGDVAKKSKLMHYECQNFLT